MCDESAMEDEVVGSDKVARVIGIHSSQREGGTVECAVLEACNTEELGLAVRDEGVPGRHTSLALPHRLRATGRDAP